MRWVLKQLVKLILWTDDLVNWLVEELSYQLIKIEKELTIPRIVREAEREVSNAEILMGLEEDDDDGREYHFRDQDNPGDR